MSSSLPPASPWTSRSIGLALSGGGVRAATFHLGVLARLAEDTLLERVTFISTVSGGSMAAGLVFALAGHGWPTSATYRDDVLPRAYQLLTGKSLQVSFLGRWLTRPWLWRGGRAMALASSLRSLWGITMRLSDLPHTPRWVINATLFETGKNWRFAPRRMGDYRYGYVLNPDFPVAEAIAASAAVPGLIGPLVLSTARFAWVRYARGGKETTPNNPATPRVRLWDGGVYDNLGVEALFKPGRAKRYRDEYDFLIVSDASAALGFPPPRYQYHLRGLRLIDTATDQVRSLRARSLAGHFLQVPTSGAYLRMGNSSPTIARQARLGQAEATQLGDGCLADEEVSRAAGHATTLRQLSDEQFQCLFRHGWEVAQGTLRAYFPALTPHRTWSHTAWPPG